MILKYGYDEDFVLNDGDGFDLIDVLVGFDVKIEIFC